jgi:uncharacterized membrane protein
MNLLAAHIPTAWSPILWLLAGGALAIAARRAAWRMLRDAANLNVLLGTCVALLGIWLIRTGVKPGLDFHLLGATVMTLMFRPGFALLGLALVLAAVTALHGEFHAYPANLLIMAVLPILVSWGLYRLVDRRLPNHLFIYLFLNCFFGAGLAIGTVGLASTLFVAAAGSYAPAYLQEEYLPFYLLMAWAEALSTGMIMTLLVVYRPEWVATFDDRRYLGTR